MMPSPSEDMRRVETFIRAASSPINDSENYKGLRIHTTQGLHEFVAMKIQEHLLPQTDLLDLGTGTGAMSLRLSDLGYRLTASDIVRENYKLHDIIPLILVSLNDSFSRDFTKQFDGIVAMEVIEHLENPRNFFRECHKLMKSGGKIIISTPNIDNPISKASFMRDGTFQWFQDFDYNEQGHITPISQWLLRKIVDEVGFSILWMGSFGDPYLKFGKWWKLRMLARLIQVISKSTHDFKGEILVAVLQKP